MLLILGNGGDVPINDNIVNDLANGQLTPAASWIVMIGLVALYGVQRVVPRRPPAQPWPRRAPGRASRS